ncbi:unnamed protein product [Linum trigynum]
MATKRVGRKIYEEEDDARPLGGARRSVWINRQHRNQSVGGRNDAGVGGQNFVQNVVKVEPLVPAEEAGGSRALGDQPAHQGQGSGKMPSDRGSPRGFLLNRSPKIRLGSGRLKQQGKRGQKKTGADAAACSQSVAAPRPCSVPPPGGEQPNAIWEETRRRRLILDNDSDDDMADGIPMAAPEALLQPEQVMTSADPVVFSLPKETVAVKPLKKGTRRGKQQPVQKPSTNQAGGAAIDGGPQRVSSGGKRTLRKGKARAAEQVQGGRDSPQGKANLAVYEDDVVPSAAAEGSHPRIAMVKTGEGAVVASGSEESGDDNHCFIIRKRSPRAALTMAEVSTKGRVGQVVAAFEAGLSIEDEIGEPSMTSEAGGADVTGEKNLTGVDAAILDEYGSNLLNPPSGLHKRPLEAVEGEMGAPPTPKKQFVEMEDVTEKVEEASLEWPQPVK